MEFKRQNAVLVRHETVPEAWCVESAPSGDGRGATELAIFAGPDAKARAIEYGYAKYASLRETTRTEVPTL